MRLDEIVRNAALAAASAAILWCAAPAVAAGPESVAGLAATLSPAVVNIGTTRTLTGRGQPFPDFPEGSPLEDMFRELNPNRDGTPSQQSEARSLGSGFIVSPDGVVVTNNHVIEGATEILVFLTDGRRLVAEVVGADDKTDLAVLKIESSEPLPFVPFGDSDGAEVGDWVMAIGNPFGLGGSVTLGIVSARNRDIQSGPYDSFIQTDASINQGNSGGPLFNMDGEVVGINTAIVARGGSALGIGFAVPVNLARPVIDQLREFGATRRGWLGVGIQEVSEDMALSLALAGTPGALVIDITRDGPADGAISEGDIILEFNGRAITRMRDLPRIVAETAAGMAVPVKVLRGGEEVVIDVTLGQLETSEPPRRVAARSPDADPGAIPDEPVGPPPGVPEIMGFDIGPIDAARRAEFELPRTARGVLVTDVTPGTDAERKGLLAGLVISEVNQRRVETVEDVGEIVGAAKEAGRPAVLFKVTDPAGSSRFVAVRLR